MILKLKWRDFENNVYFLGELTRDDSKYYFRVNEEGVKNATDNGCFGIGILDLTNKFHVSEELFTFFKHRIPPRDRMDIEEILNEYGLKEYDEMELLRVTKGMLMTDNYFLTE